MANSCSVLRLLRLVFRPAVLNTRIRDQRDPLRARWGDSIDDTNLLRAGSTAAVLGHTVLAPSTLGTFLRSFTWGHRRQIDRVAGELLTRAWAAGGGPGDRPVTIDMDSSIHETYGLKKQGAKFGYSKVRGYHPLYAVFAGTGDIVHCPMCILRSW